MNTKTVFQHILIISAGLWLVPLTAGADFIIELHSGRQVTVEHYEDDGEKIAIQTDLGMIGFRKADVKQITEVTDPQGLRGPLGESVGRPTVSKRAATPDMAEEPPAQAGTGKMGEAAQGDEAQKEPLTPEQIAQIDQQYQKVNQNYESLWEQYKRYLKDGASAEEMAENKKGLLALDKERQLIRRKIREEARQEDFPAWMRSWVR